VSGRLPRIRRLALVARPQLVPPEPEYVYRTPEERRATIERLFGRDERGTGGTPVH
jgi:hypothetical protein